MKKYTVTSWSEFSPKAYVSNGFTGFRIGKNPFKDVIAMLGGFTTVRKGGLVEAMALIPAPKLTFTYKYKNIEPETLSQTYDFSCGEFTTVVSLDCDGEKTEVTYIVFCSRTSPTLFIGSLSAKGELENDLRVTVEYEICDGWKETVSDTVYHGNWHGQYDGKCQIFSYDRSTSAGVAFQLQGSCEDKIHSSEMCVTATLDTA